ncbi:substrate-binding domain-containing protein [Leptothoe sp. ISB3NOV94-8A]
MPSPTPPSSENEQSSTPKAALPVNKPSLSDHLYGLPKWLIGLILFAAFGGATVVSELTGVIDSLGSVIVAVMTASGSSGEYKPVAPEPSAPEYKQVQSLLKKPSRPTDVFNAVSDDLQKLTADGSISVIAMVRELQRQYPGISLVYGVNDQKPLGTDDGLLKLANGDIEFAFASRELTRNEKEVGNLVEFPIGKDAIAVFVHKDNPIDNLNIDQLKAIYNCQVDDWSIFGWSNLGGNQESFGIDVFNRYRSSGTQSVFNKKVLDGQAFCGGEPDTDGERENGSSFRTWNADETTTVINEMGKYGIYYASLNHVVNQDDIKVLSINDIFPSAETILQEEYLLTRDLYAVAKRDTYQSVIEFIDFLISPKGQEIVRQYHIPSYEYE